MANEISRFLIRQAVRCSIAWLTHALAFGSMGCAAFGDEVPIYGAYGTLTSCLLWSNGAERHVAGDDDFVILTRKSLEGLEWGCDFEKVARAGPSSWQIEGKCAGTGDHEDGSPIPETPLTIEEARDRSSAIVSAPNFFTGVQGGSLTLPSCNLPYDEQLRLEIKRVEGSP